VFHSISNRLDFLGFAWWRIPRQNRKAMAIEHLLISSYSEYEMHLKISIYKDLGIGFI
jgi:hypothetical protein